MLDQLFESNQVLCGMQGRLILLKGADAMAMEDKIGRQEFVGKICRLVDSLKKTITPALPSMGIGEVVNHLFWE